jgi:DDE superfamily endonuclease
VIRRYCGTANIFIAVEFKAGKRMTQVTERRTMTDFAQFVKILVIEGYPKVEVIRVVIDNLNIHKKKAFYETFSEDEAKHILEKTEFHYAPKHASWLNAAKIEINVTDIECTIRRIGNIGTLTNEVGVWTNRRIKRKRKSTGSLRRRMPMRSCPSIMFYN